jgi:hypothetical protein
MKEKAQAEESYRPPSVLLGLHAAVVPHTTGRLDDHLTAAPTNASARFVTFREIDRNVAGAAAWLLADLVPRTMWREPVSSSPGHDHGPNDKGKYATPAPGPAALRCRHPRPQGGTSPTAMLGSETRPRCYSASEIGTLRCR